MSKDKMKSYNVWARCQQFVSVEIRALNLDEALQKAKEMKEEKFVEVNGEYCDGDFKITGVLESE